MSPVESLKLESKINPLNYLAPFSGVDLILFFILFDVRIKSVLTRNITIANMFPPQFELDYSIELYIRNMVTGP